MMSVRIPLWTWPVAGVAPTLAVSRPFVPATRSAPTWGGGLVKIGALRRPVGRAFMLGCFAGCTKNIQRSARLPVLLQQQTVLAANPMAWLTVTAPAASVSVGTAG